MNGYFEFCSEARSGGAGSPALFEAVVVCTPGADLTSQGSSTFPNAAHLASHFSLGFVFFQPGSDEAPSPVLAGLLAFFPGLM